MSTENTLLEPCKKCGENWANPTLRNDKEGQAFLIRCGKCGHESESVDLSPAIKSWNESGMVVGK